MNYAFDEANRQVNAGGVTYDWDLNGNLLSDGNNTYTYDHANHLVGVSDGQSSATFAYNGLGDRLQQTVGGVTTQYTLDLNNSLTQVLSDGTNRYLYGMGRIAQQTPNGLQYFLPDALGSVRQLTGATGALALVQSFDPYGGLLSSQGSAATPYGFTGEWGDASGLIYLRARYYLPQAGIFTTRDPFPGFTTLPVTLQPYLYAAGNPLRYTDPSGEIIPFLVAAGLGGLISGGIDLGAQLLAMHPQSLSQALRCVNWGEVGIAFVGGAVAGLTGFTIFGATTALLGSGFFANLAAGTISGVVAGQYARLTGLVLSGKTDQISSTMFRPKDLLVDSILGAFGGAINYGLQRGFSGIAEDILQRVTNSANQRLAANPGLAQNVLRPREYAAGQANPAVARMEYGNAVERMVARQIDNSFVLKRLFRYTSAPNRPDFMGSGPFTGLSFDITTNTQRSIASHLARGYGRGLILLLYNRSSNFTVFP